MSKDPAILFYTSDFLSGTAFFTFEQKGQYIQLLCEQHQLGLIPESHMKLVCGSLESVVVTKFIKTAEGFYYNKRMQEEAEKRQKWCNSRRQNKLRDTHMSPHMSTHMSRHMTTHMSPHMGNGNGNEDRDLFKPSLAKKKKEDSNCKRFIDIFCSTYEAKLGNKYIFLGGKDGKIVKELLSCCEIDRLLQLVIAYFDSQEPFIIQNKYSLAVFRSQVNKLEIKKERKQDF